MNNRVIGLILVIIGLIIMAFPILGIIPFSLITGLVISFIGIGLLLASKFLMKESRSMGILSIILGIIALILGIIFIVNPGFFSLLVALVVFLVGILLVGVGIAIIIGKLGIDIRLGIFSIVLGIMFLVIALLVSNPLILGTLIGLSILITGFLMLIRRENREIIIYKL